VVKFLIDFFRVKNLLPEFLFGRDFWKTRFVKSGPFLAHAHLLQRKYLLADCLFPLTVPENYTEPIQNILWRNRKGTDPDGSVQSKIFEPIYQLCLERLQPVYLNFSQKYSIEDLFNDIVIKDQPRKRSFRKLSKSSPLMLVSSKVEPVDWSIEMVTHWLHQNGLGEYGPIFSEHLVNGEVLFELTDQDLTDELMMMSRDRDKFRERLSSLRS